MKPAATELKLYAYYLDKDIDIIEQNIDLFSASMQLRALIELKWLNYLKEKSNVL